MPVNTSYLNHAKSIAFPSLFTVALSATGVGVGATAHIDSSFSVPARLLPLGTGNLALRANDVLVVGPPSAVSAGLMWGAFAAPTTNTVTLRLVNGSTSTATQIASTWAIGYFGIMP